MSLGMKRPREEAIEIGMEFIHDFGVVDRCECVLAGSIRREVEIVGDIDIVIVVQEEKYTRDVLNERLIQMFGSYKTKPWKGKRVGVYKSAQVNVFDTLPCSLGAMLWHSTGSGQLNIIMRNRARDLGLMLNQYGLFDKLTGEPVVDASTEIAILEALDFDIKYMNPVNRSVRSDTDKNLKRQMKRISEKLELF